MSCTPASGTHPCFDEAAHHSHARVHLPVAPRCNVQCNFCSRKHDCVNESRPGVSTAVLAPDQAGWYLDALRKREPRLSVVGIAGPGDPLANPRETLATLRRARDDHPDLHLCLSTNGLALPEHVDALAGLGLSHLTVTVNAVDPEIGGRIYGWVRDGGRVLRGAEGGRRLLLRQIAGIRAAVAAGMTVKINCIQIPGVNDHHVVEVAAAMAALGAARFNLMPMIPVAGTPFAIQGEPDLQHHAALREEAAAHLPQMRHCHRCRADAAGLIGEHQSLTATRLLQEAADMPSRPAEKPYVAVASLEGVFVNCHLGHAERLLIYAQEEDCFVLVDVRQAPEPGLGAARWQHLADLLQDCRAVVAAEAGATPQRVLEPQGIAVHATEGPIADALELVFTGQGGELRRPSCGSGSCGGGHACGEGGGMACA